MSRKKSVLKDDNPAMNFISSASIDDEAVDNDKAAIIENLDLEDISEDIPPEGYKLNPAYIEKYIEKKTKRVQLLMQPSLYDRLKAAATSEGESLNNYIHDMLTCLMDIQDKQDDQ